MKTRTVSKLLPLAALALVALAPRARADEPVEATRRLLARLEAGEKVEDQLVVVSDPSAVISWIGSHTLVSENHACHPAAIQVLARLEGTREGLRRLIPSLVGCLSHRDFGCQLAALRFVDNFNVRTITAALGEPALAQALVQLEASQDNAVSMLALKLLRELTGKSEGTELAPWASWLERTYHRRPDLLVAAPEIVAAIDQGGSGAGNWRLNGEDVLEVELERNLGALRNVATQLRVVLRVVLPSAFSRALGLKIREVLARLPERGLATVVVENSRENPRAFSPPPGALFALVPAAIPDKPAPAPPPSPLPLAKRLVVTGILLDAEKSNLAVVCYLSDRKIDGKPVWTERVYAPGDQVKDDSEAPVPGLTIKTIEAGAITCNTPEGSVLKLELKTP